MSDLNSAGHQCLLLLSNNLEKIFVLIKSNCLNVENIFLPKHDTELLLFGLFIGFFTIEAPQ